MKGIYLIIASIVGTALLLSLLVYWQNYRSPAPQLISDSQNRLAGPLTPKEQKVNDPTMNDENNPIAVIKTNLGEFELELFAKDMPITTGNFIALAESGFYNNTKFHRVIDGFMIQGGDPNSKGKDESIYGMGGPGKTIQDEFVAGAHLSNIRGTISMANTGQPNSGGSQFFINLVDNTGLDFDKEPFSSKHPVFGRVISGMEVVDQIGKVETKTASIPVEPVVIESITIVRQ